MLTIDDISYSVEGRLLLDGASARIPAGHKAVSYTHLTLPTIYSV